MSRPASIIGIGQVTLDVQAWHEPPYSVGAGGTVVNVLARLAACGWQTLLLARLGRDPAGDILRADLERARIGCQGVSQEEKVATAVMVQEAFGPQPRFSTRCPQCGAELPDVAEPAMPMPLPDPPSVFFFDRDSPTALHLAKHYRAAGSLIVYEPNYVGPEVPLDCCLSLAHVLKCSAETVPGLADYARHVPLVVETLAADGLRWRENGQAWNRLAAPAIANLRDTTGCGDALTAALLDGWHQGREWAWAIEQAQEVAAHKACYVGARGDLVHGHPQTAGAAGFCARCRSAKKIGLV